MAQDRNTSTNMTPAPIRFSRKRPEVRKQLLIEAAIACLAKHGMSGFTIANICAEAGISRGLISHHFKGKDALLVAAYEALTAHLIPIANKDALAEQPPAAVLLGVIEKSFSDSAYERSTLKAWLALWGETASNAQLYALHRKRYDSYHQGLTATISALAAARGCKLDPDLLATQLIALIDGLWLEWCIDETRIPADAAITACKALLEPQLGPLANSAAG